MAGRQTHMNKRIHKQVGIKSFWGFQAAFLDEIVRKGMNSNQRRRASHFR